MNFMKLRLIKSHPIEPKAVVSFKSLSDGDYYRRYLTKILSNIL